MSDEVSPAGTTAQNADSPADDTTRADSSAAPARATRRRTTTTRTPRTRKAAVPAEVPPMPPPHEEPTVAPAAAESVAPASERFTSEEAAPETVGKATRTRRGTRGGRGRSAKAAADAPVDAATATEPLPPAAEIADAATIPSPEPKPTRRRTDRRAATPAGEVAEVAPTLIEVPLEAEGELAPSEPAAEPPAPRRSRGRRRAESAPPVEPVAGTPPLEEETAAPEPTALVEATGPEQKPTRRTRGGRRRGGRTVAEPQVEAPSAAEESEAVPAPEAKPARPRRARKAAEPAEDLTVGARLIHKRGLVELHVQGKVFPPILFFGNVEGEKEERRVVSEVKRAAAAGVHLHSTLIEIPCPLPPDDTVYELLDSRLQTILDADADGYVMPRLVFLPAPGWMRQYPNEVSHYADGKSADPSIASDRFWTDAEHALEAVVDHLQRTTYGQCVLGYHLERGEWFNPADNGYDRSFANRESFREWLRRKYKNSVVALRAGWYDGDVQFHTAEIPPMPSSPKPDMAFFEPRKQRRWIDFLEYTSDITVDRLIALSGVVKRVSQNRALVSVCYGYTFEFEHTFSGHLALGRLLATPTIDILSGPPSYKDRRPGQAGSLPAPVDSMLVHGKLWVSEDDTKTHLAPSEDTPDDFNPRLDSRYATDQVHLRAIGKAMAHQTGIAFMDLWGEGWLDADDIWSRVSTFRNRYDSFIKLRKAQAPDVVVLVDERSLLHVQRGPAFLRRLLIEQREAIQKAGASVGFYLQSDVTAKGFPTEAKLYVFLNPYRLPSDQRAAIREKLRNGNKTLVWMYAAGVCDERGEPDESAHEVMGITLRQQSWNSEVGSRILESRHPIVERMIGRDIGVRERLNPSFYVDDDDPNLTVLGEYAQSGLPSMAVKEMDGWRTVFCGEPALTTDLFRGLCKYAGAHLYTPFGEDYFSAGFGWVMSHTAREGNRTLLLPPRSALYDINEERYVGESLSEYKAFVKANVTRRFFTGAPEDMRKLGFPGVERGRARRRSPEPLSTPPVEEPVPVHVLPDVAADEEDEALEEAIAETEQQPAGEENGDAAHHRRRRRRGGRGRGRRRHGGEGAPGGETPAPAPPAGA